MRHRDGDEAEHRDEREEEREHDQRDDVDVIHASGSRVAKYTTAVMAAPMPIQANWYQ